MKIEIEHFGPIEKFSYDLDKDFIVTYGNNNIGKSYSMQIVYLLLKSFLNCSPVRWYGGMRWVQRGFGLDFSVKGYEKIVQEFLESNRATEDITDKIICDVYNILKDIFLSEFVASCESTFGNLDKTLQNNPIIHIKYDIYDFHIYLTEKKIVGKINSKPVFLKKTESDFHKRRNWKEHLDIYVVSDINPPVQLIAQQVLAESNRLFQVLRKNYENVFFYLHQDRVFIVE